MTGYIDLTGDPMWHGLQPCDKCGGPATHSFVQDPIIGSQPWYWCDTCDPQANEGEENGRT